MSLFTDEQLFEVGQAVARVVCTIVNQVDQSHDPRERYENIIKVLELQLEKAHAAWADVEDLGLDRAGD